MNAFVVCTNSAASAMTSQTTNPKMTIDLLHSSVNLQFSCGILYKTKKTGRDKMSKPDSQDSFDVRYISALS